MKYVSTVRDICFAYIDSAEGGSDRLLLQLDGGVIPLWESRIGVGLIVVMVEAGEKLIKGVG